MHRDGPFAAQAAISWRRPRCRSRRDPAVTPTAVASEQFQPRSQRRHCWSHEPGAVSRPPRAWFRLLLWSGGQRQQQSRSRGCKGDIAEAPRRRGRAAATRPERARVDAASRRSLLAHEAEARRPSRRRQRSALPHWKRKRRVRQRGAWMPALVVRLLAGVPSGARGRRTPTMPVFRDAKPRWFGKRDFLRRNQLELP